MSMRAVLISVLFLAFAAPSMAQYVEEPALPQTTEARAARLAELKAKTAEALAAGNHELALMRIEAAMKLSDDPGLVANKAFILEKLGQYKASAEAFQQYLDTVGEAGPKVEMAKKLLERLRPEVTFNSTPPGATVTPQGSTSPLGTTPFRAKHVAGTVLFIVEREGYTPLRHLVRILPDTPVKVDVELARKAPPKPIAPVEPAVIAKPKQIAEDDDDEGSTSLAWISLGTAAAAATAAGLFYGSGLDAATARDEATKGADWDEHQASLETANMLYLGTGGLAVVTGIVGAYLLIIAQSDEPETLSSTPFSNPFSVEF